MAKTYNDIYINARRALKAAGIESYGLEARLIVSQASGKTMEQLTRDLSLYATDELDRQVMELVERRLAGEPVAYITGSWEFYGIPLEITRDVLIPRTDTELLVQAAIQLFAGRNAKPRILDLCTGSGCIGCALAVYMPGARLVLADNAPMALRLCRRNIEKNNLELRVICVEADATKKPPMLLGHFDLVVCNPPYIPTADLAELDPSVRDYEPAAALDGGDDGLDIIRPIIRLWKRVLKPGGTLMLEVCEGQSQTVQELMTEAGFVRTGALQDTNGTERVVVGHI
ncbi:MAG: peptide chain release factor N(5)-glutamine methyltransferase [Oscillospiraceae bacterium]|nr:peptide chain release factor N(5)-glutamine methyltransferase [Oscillospiraceae bacterium]